MNRWEAVVTFEDPEHRVRPEANKSHRDWRAMEAYRRARRKLFAAHFLVQGRPRPPAWPVTVTWTRIGSKRSQGIDDDNLPSCFKSFRDELVKLWGFKDDSGSRFIWKYRQTKSDRPGYFAAHCHMVCEWEGGS